MLEQDTHLLYGVEGRIVHKVEVKDYIERVKRSNPDGVVLCIDTKEGTHERMKTDGAFNVYFQVDDKIYLDYVGRGFDVGAVTKGRENHEAWMVDWNDALFVRPSNMNRYRVHLISSADYLASARRRIMQLLGMGYTREDVKGKIPGVYETMPQSFKKMLLDDIVVPIYQKRDGLVRDGLKSFGVQGMIINKRLHPIEFNRMERMAERSAFGER